LYTNEDGFIVERKLGQTWYYYDVLKSAIEKYALSDNPNYDELGSIVKRIDTYMSSSRYEGALDAPIYIESSYATDIYFIRADILKMNWENMVKEKIHTFFKRQIKRIDKATERQESSLWSS
jgi:hypothetical protein